MKEYKYTFYHIYNDEKIIFQGDSLVDANLKYADFTGAKLQNADLTGAKLTGAKLTGAKLTGADLTGAILDGACFKHAKLDGVIGLYLSKINEEGYYHD